MSPTLLLLRLLAVLMIPLLVAPTIVSADRDRPAPAVRTAALALPVADQAAELADPLAAPPALVRPARKADGATTLAPAPARLAQAEAPGAEPPAVTPDAPAGAKGEETPESGASDTASQDKAPTGKDPKAAVRSGAKTSKPTPRAAKQEPAAEKKAAARQKPAAKKKAAARQKPAAEKKAEQAGRARAAAAAPAAAPPAPRTLYLGVGHGRASNGRWQPGAEHSGKGAFEVDAAQVMVDAMVEVLRDAPNLEVHAESGDHPNVVGSVARANGLGVDDCIEVHQDTAAAPPGVFGHWYAGASAASRLADRLVGAVADQGVPVRHDWHRARSGLYWVRKSECRAVLMEVGRVGDYSVEQLRAFGHAMATAYLRDTKKARGIG